MSSTPAGSYLALLTTTIGNAVCVAMGAILSIGVPWLLVERFRAIAAKDDDALARHSPPLDRAAARRHGEFGDAILALTTSFAATGYFGASFYFYAYGNVAAVACVRGALVVVGSAVGAALSGWAVLVLRRWVG